MKNDTRDELNKWLKKYEELKRMYLLCYEYEIEKRNQILNCFYNHVKTFENILRDVIEETFPFYDKLDIEIIQSTKLRFLSNISMTYHFMNEKYCYRYTTLFQNLENDIQELEYRLRGLRYENEVL